MSSDIVMLGFCGWDYVSVIPNLPVDDKVEITQILEQGGGPAATAAVASARLGISTAFVGAVAGDMRGRMIVEEFEREGVDVSGLVVREDGASPAAFCWSDTSTGGRSIAWTRGTAQALSAEEIPVELIRSAKVLHLDGHQTEAAIAAAKLARENGVIVSLDAGTYKPHMDELMPLCDVVITSEVFARDLIGKEDPDAAVAEILSRGCSTAIVTLGGRGCVGSDAGGAFKCPSFKIDVVDTTGAGDVFHGAFCTGIVRGWNAEKTARFSSGVSALKCAKAGGRTGIPDYETVVDFIKDK